MVSCSTTLGGRTQLQPAISIRSYKTGYYRLAFIDPLPLRHPTLRRGGSRTRTLRHPFAKHPISLLNISLSAPTAVKKEYGYREGKLLVIADNEATAVPSGGVLTAVNLALNRTAAWSAFRKARNRSRKRRCDGQSVWAA